MSIKFIALIAGLIFLSSCQSRPTEITITHEIKIASEVNSAFQGLVQASKTLDHERYFSYFDSEKYTALVENGTVIHSFDVFRQTYEPQLKFLKSYNNLTFDNVKIDVIDANTAVLVNEYSAEVVLTTGDIVSAGGAGTQVWSKRTGEWKLVNVSSSVKPLDQED